MRETKRETERERESEREDCGVSYSDNLLGRMFAGIGIENSITN